MSVYGNADDFVYSISLGDIDKQLNISAPKQQQIMEYLDCNSSLAEMHQQHRAQQLSRWLRYYYDLWDPPCTEPIHARLNDIRDLNECILNIYYIRVRIEEINMALREQRMPILYLLPERVIPEEIDLPKKVADKILNDMRRIQDASEESDAYVIVEGYRMRLMNVACVLTVGRDDRNREFWWNSAVGGGLKDLGIIDIPDPAIHRSDDAFGFTIDVFTPSEQEIFEAMDRLSNLEALYLALTVGDCYPRYYPPVVRSYKQGIWRN
jgi:hypothetical protein